MCLLSLRNFFHLLVSSNVHTDYAPAIGFILAGINICRRWGGLARTSAFKGPHMFFRVSALFGQLCFGACAGAWHILFGPVADRVVETAKIP